MVTKNAVFMRSVAFRKRLFSKKYQLEVRKEFEKIDTMQILQKNNVERQERI